MNFKKYILKPGRHQFAPGEHAAHDNDNLTDEAAAWYLKRYPHIRSLFSTIPTEDLQQTKTIHCKKNPKSKIRIPKSNDENLSTTN